ncbi:pyruvate kinase [Thermosphaera chiliense]|uniref:Pyruvate kinase n=1 Tax=Thermosphaera chiliense TaxID=3402707 RepID=A0A7M1UUE6_9CREN|nr:pyruvate kinase [Thermosphaera aggregans]QOR94614.1 pyruvate kinase [Thermosphaera aggregans]
MKPRVKILATLGPSSGDFETVRRMIREGASGFRINYAHGDARTWDLYVKIVREASAELGETVSVIGDLPGPQVRSGDFEGFSVTRGDQVRLEHASTSSGARTIPVPVRELFISLEPGDVVLYGDGEISLRVLSVDEHSSTLLVLNDGVVKPRKKIVVQGKEISLPMLSGRDVELLNHAVSNQLTYVALSYVRSSRDVELVRNMLRGRSFQPRVIAKIETRSAYLNLKEIAESSDAVLVARGDLGLHFPLEEIPLIQKNIVSVADSLGKPSIVATQVMESMIENPRPSRSDVVDVYNSVYDMVDAVMLTNETAVGKYPVETVKWTRRIIETAESRLDPAIPQRSRRVGTGLMEKYAHGLLSLAESLNAKILVYTKGNTVPPLISKHRPLVPVYVGTSSKVIAEALTIYYGLTPVNLGGAGGDMDYEKGVEELYRVVREKRLIDIGDVVVKAYVKSGTGVHEIIIEEVK